MAFFDSGIGQFLRALPELIKTAVNVETKTDPGRVNLVLCLAPMILIAILDAGLDAFDRLMNLILVLNDKVPPVLSAENFDWGLPITFLMFMAICMFFTTFTFLTVARLEAGGQENTR